MHRVFVEGLELHAFHGVTDDEQRIGHRVRVDVELEVEGDAPTTDRLEGTCDYAAVCRTVAASLQATPMRTLERAAQNALDAIFADFPTVAWTSISVAKLQPAFHERATAVGVRLSRARNPSKKT